MDTTPPTVLVLHDPGASKHLRLRGVVGGGSITMTDADLRDATSDELRVVAALTRQRFISVEVTGVGRLDKTHTVSFEVPGITTVEPAPVKRRRVPPRARQKRSK